MAEYVGPDGDTAHKLDEFSNFPWDQLDDDWFRQCGGTGCGGITAGVDFNPQSFHISFIREDCSRDTWEIPTQLQRLFDAYKNRGNREGKVKFRHLLKQLNEELAV